MATSGALRERGIKQGAIPAIKLAVDIIADWAAMEEDRKDLTEGPAN